MQTQPLMSQIMVETPQECGKIDWNEATEWVSQLNYGGFSDWRLPTVKPINGSTFQIRVGFDGSTDFGEHITSPQSEMSYMYYVNLQNASVHNTTGVYIGCGSTGACLTNTALFDNLLADNYWTGSEIDTTFAWSFNAQHGIQTPFDGKANLFYAWALRSGDVAVAPLPSTFWLYLFCLLGLTTFLIHFPYTQIASRDNVAQLKI